MPDLSMFSSIKTFIFDVDGVMTNNQILVNEAGECLRSMNIRDGYAIRRAVRKGFGVFVITAGKSEGVIHRLKDLGIQHIYTEVRDKLSIYNSLVEEYNLEESTILYMGDDIPDMEVMQKVGLPVCPSDAVPEIKAISAYISPLPGGHSCVRDVIEKVLKLQGHWID